MNDDKYMSDDELRIWCIQNYATPKIGECVNCPYTNKCNDFIDRHDGNTPLFG